MSFFADQVTRKARRPHRCIWCGESIEVGSTYSYQTGVMDGRWQSNHWHPECVNACLSDPYYDRDEGFTPHDNERPTP